MRTAMTKDDVSVALTKAFRDLRKRGWRAKRNFACCSGCGHYKLAQAPGPFVFFSRQTQASTFANRRLDAFTPDRPLYLQWRADATHPAQELVGVLGAHGLVVRWDGEERSCVAVTGGVKEEA